MAAIASAPGGEWDNPLALWTAAGGLDIRDSSDTILQKMARPAGKPGGE